MMQKDWFRALGAASGLTEDAIEYILPVAVELEGSALLKDCWQAILAHESGGALLDAADYGCESNRLKLAACVLLTRDMLALYEKRGIDTAIYRDSLKDIPIWAACCRAETGLWGMKQFGWLSNTLRCELWRLGRFQFERVEFEAERYERNGVALREGDPVVNVHIPEGESLRKELRDDAYARAAAFFGSNVFVCDSWLLWPEHRRMLSPDANIIGFMDDFDLIRYEERPGVNDLWRIFGYLADYRPEALPEDTGLRRAYKAKLLENGGLTGSGYGIRIQPA